MSKSGLILLWCLAVAVHLPAQQVLPRDTSYTLRSTYEKVNKHHPELHASPAYEAPSVRITIQKDVVYRTVGERELRADLFYPNKRGEYPGLLMVHGGGWRAGDKSLMTPMAQRFADAGYVVMAPEYRLSTEAPYPAAVYDLKAAIRWMRENERKLPLQVTEIVILGCSAGGQLAALVGTTNDQPEFEGLEHPEFSSAVQAIVDMDGVLAFIHPLSEESSVAAQWLGGSAAEIPEVWHTASALSHVDSLTPPTLFLASRYPRFLAGREEYAAALQKYGTYTDTRQFPEAPHSFWLLHPWFEPTVTYVIGFLRMTFGGTAFSDEKK